MLLWVLLLLVYFFFNDPATTEIYPLSLHDALPIPSRRCVSISTCILPAKPNVPTSIGVMSLWSLGSRISVAFSPPSRKGRLSRNRNPSCAGEIAFLNGGDLCSMKPGVYAIIYASHHSIPIACNRCAKHWRLSSMDASEDVTHWKVSPR